MRSADAGPSTRRGLSVLLLAFAGLSSALAQGPGRTNDTWAALRLLHLAPEAGPVHVWVDEVRAFAHAEPGALPHYVDVRAGTAEIRIVAVVTEDDEEERESAAAAAPILQEPPDTAARSLRLEPSSYGTLLLLPGSVEGEAPEVTLIMDPLSELPPAGQVGLRLVHADFAGAPLALVAREADDGGSVGPAPAFEAPEDADSDHVSRLDPMGAGPHVMVSAGRRDLWLVREDGDAVAGPLDVELRVGTLYTLFAVPPDPDAADSTGTADGAPALLVVDATAPVPLDRADE